MTRQEFGSLITIIRSVYRDKDFLSDMSEMEVWYSFLKDYSFGESKIAVTKLATSSKWIPSIAEIVEQIRLLHETVTGSDGDSELWALIVSASKNSTYGAVDEFNKLPEQCRKFLGSASVLKDFGQIDPNTLQTVVKSQFMKAIPSIRKKTDYNSGLPLEVREVIENAKAQRLLEEHLY